MRPAGQPAGGHRSQRPALEAVDRGAMVAALRQQVVAPALPGGGARRLDLRRQRRRRVDLPGFDATARRRSSSTPPSRKFERCSGAPTAHSTPARPRKPAAETPAAARCSWHKAERRSSWTARRRTGEGGFCRPGGATTTSRRRPCKARPGAPGQPRPVARPAGPGRLGLAQADHRRATTPSTVSTPTEFRVKSSGSRRWSTRSPGSTTA